MTGSSLHQQMFCSWSSIELSGWMEWNERVWGRERARLGCAGQKLNGNKHHCVGFFSALCCMCVTPALPTHCLPTYLGRYLASLLLPAWSASAVFSSTSSNQPASRTPDHWKAPSRTQSAGASMPGPCTPGRLSTKCRVGKRSTLQSRPEMVALGPVICCVPTTGWACGSSGPVAAEIDMRVGIAPVSYYCVGLGGLEML